MLPVLGFVSWLSVKHCTLINDRSLSRIHLLAVDRLVPGHGRAGTDGAVVRIRRVYCQHQHRQQPIAQYIAISLKPLRDFLWCFSRSQWPRYAVATRDSRTGFQIAAVLLALKPAVFHVLVRGVFDEPKGVESGLRLVMRQWRFDRFLGLSKGILSAPAATLIQTTTVVTLLVSSYLVVLTLPTPSPSGTLTTRLRRRGSLTSRDAPLLQIAA